MFESVADTIRKLRSLFWSERDPAGQGFVALADAYREAGDLDEAEKLLSEGLERHPDLSSGHVVLARVRRDRGEVDGALDSYRRVLQLDAENTEATEAILQLEALAEPPPEEWSSGSLQAEEEEGEPPLPTLEDVSAFELDQVHADDLEAEPETGHELDLEPSEVTVAESSTSEEEAWVRGAAAAAEPVDEPEPDTGVYTRTMAEVFASQGLFLRAVEVYEVLLRANPEDQALQDRVAELRSMAGVTPTPALEEEEGPGEWEEEGTPFGDSELEDVGHDWEAESEAQARHLAEGPEESDVSTPFAWTEHTEDTHEHHRETAGAYFDRLLTWDGSVVGGVDEGSDSEAGDPLGHLPLVAVGALAPDLDPGRAEAADYLPIVPISDLAPEPSNQGEWSP